jgi:hypothetical protein
VIDGVTVVPAVPRAVARRARKLYSTASALRVYIWIWNTRSAIVDDGFHRFAWTD